MSNEKALTVSIALCTYNGSQFLQHQLDSLSAQTRLPDELVVCDDCSTDDTVGIVERFATSAPFSVRFYQNPDNLGYSKNFEKAVSLCEKDVIFFCDQDDIWMPEKIEQFMSVFTAHPEVGLVMSDAELIDENGLSRGIRLSQSMGIRPNTLPNLVHSDCARFSLKYFITWQGTAVAYRNHQFDSILFPYPGELGHDTWTVRIIGAVAEARFLLQPLTLYRIHTNNVCGTSTNMPTLASGISSAKNPGLACYYLQVYQSLLLLTDRLEKFPERLRFKRTLRKYKNKADHYLVRYNIHVRKINKWLGIASQTINGNYFRFSRGIKSIISDLIG